MPGEAVVPCSLTSSPERAFWRAWTMASSDGGGGGGLVAVRGMSRLAGPAECGTRCGDAIRGRSARQEGPEGPGECGRHSWTLAPVAHSRSHIVAWLVTMPGWRSEETSH